MATIRFPIPSSEYDQTIRLLEAICLWDTLAQDCREVTMDDLPPRVSAAISPDRDGCDDLNEMCRAIEPLSTAERKELEAVVLMARPAYASEIRQLAEKIDGMTAQERHTFP